MNLIDIMKNLWFLVSFICSGDAFCGVCVNNGDNQIQDLKRFVEPFAISIFVATSGKRKKRKM